MNWLDKLERKFGFITIPNIIIYVIAGQAVATLFAMQQPGVAGQMLLDPVAVSQGEYWRLITFIFVPNTSPFSLIFAIFWFYFLWFMGKGLEQEWGAFKLTIYLMAGLACQISVSMLAYALTGMVIVQSGYYWTLSIQLAFAFLYPEFTIYMFMILPIKMRWWAWFLGAYLVFQIIGGGVPVLMMVAASLGNYLLFFGPEFWRQGRMRTQTAAVRSKMTASLKAAMLNAPEKACATCGKDALAADIRLCTCESCGENGKFWCTDDLQAHLKK